MAAKNKAKIAKVAADLERIIMFCSEKFKLKKVRFSKWKV